MTRRFGHATSVSAAVRQTIREPRLALPLARSAVNQRVVGPLLAKQRPGAVALFHIGRCGSTVLTELLEQHPKMYWDGETYGRVLDELKSAGQDRATSGFDPAAYIGERMQRSGKRWFGYDLKFFHVTDFGVSVEDYVQQVLALGVSHLIVLQRRNYLRKVVSTRLGQERGWYHTREGFSSDARRISFSDQNIQAMVQRFQLWDREYAALNSFAGDYPVLLINYEDHIQHDPLLGYKMATDFLGLEPFSAQITLRRINPEPLTELIENFDDIKTVLKDTDYAWMVESDTPC